MDADKSKYSWQSQSDAAADREIASDKLYDGYRMKLKVNKTTHRITIPKNEENESHVTVYIEPVAWPKDK